MSGGEWQRTVLKALMQQAESASIGDLHAQYCGH